MVTRDHVYEQEHADTIRTANGSFQHVNDGFDSGHGAVDCRVVVGVGDNGLDDGYEQSEPVDDGRIGEGVEQCERDRFGGVTEVGGCSDGWPYDIG